MIGSGQQQLFEIGSKWRHADPEPFVNIGNVLPVDQPHTTQAQSLVKEGTVAVVVRWVSSSFASSQAVGDQQSTLPIHAPPVDCVQAAGEVDEVSGSGSEASGAQVAVGRVGDPVPSHDGPGHREMHWPIAFLPRPCSISNGIGTVVLQLQENPPTDSNCPFVAADEAFHLGWHDGRHTGNQQHWDKCQHFGNQIGWPTTTGTTLENDTHSNIFILK